MGVIASSIPFIFNIILIKRDGTQPVDFAFAESVENGETQGSQLPRYDAFRQKIIP